MHGHRFELEIGIQGKINKNTGMIIDFKDLKNLIKDPIDFILDHKLLNEYIENPTCENIIMWIIDYLKEKLNPIMYESLSYIKLHETADSYCEQNLIVLKPLI